jgi:hypothetical protein
LISREWYRYLNNQYTKANQNANVVTPGDYGAIGDGAVDDSASIQAALDSGYDVYLPPGRIYAIGTTLTMSTPNQSFGGPGVLRIVGAINGVELISPTSLIVTGIQLDLTFDSPAQTAGWAVYVNNSSRIKISKLNIIDGYGGLYVQVANWVVVDWMWASLRGPGIKWYGDSTHRSDVLNLGFVVVDPGEGQYGMDWDGNCHSLNVLELGIVCGGGGGKGMIIRNTSGSPFPYIPAIGRIAHIEIDYAASHGIEIQEGLDYDFCIPYVLGCGTWPGYSGVYDGFHIAPGINAYEVRITGGKSVGNTGYGINNLGGVILYSGNTALYSNVLGEINGDVWTKSPRYVVDDYFYSTVISDTPYITFAENDFLSYNRAANQLNLQINGAGTVTFSGLATQSYVPVYATGLRLLGSTTGYTGFSPAATGPSVTYTLPTAVGGINQVLSTDGSNNLFWATVSGGGGVTSVGVTSPVVNTGTSTAPVIAVNATSANTPLYLVQRNGSGDFAGNYITGVGFYADATYYMQMVGSNPTLVFDTNDYLSYDRTNNAYNFQIAGSGIFSASATAIQAYKPFRILGSSSGYVGLTVPATAGSTTYTLPSSDGSNGQFLKTDGSGGLTWASGNAGTVTSVGATSPVVSSGGTTPTISVNASSANTASYLVQRDGSGNFTAGTITATQFSLGSNYYLSFLGSNPFQAWSGTSYVSYDRTTDQLNSVIAGNGVFVLASTYAQSLKPLVLPQYTVATLPTGIQGAMAYVTDALVPMYNTTVVGGGSSVVRVFFDGTSWKT